MHLIFIKFFIFAMGISQSNVGPYSFMLLPIKRINLCPASRQLEERLIAMTSEWKFTQWDSAFECPIPHFHRHQIHKIHLLVSTWKKNHATRIWLNLFVVVAENFSYFSSPLIHIIFDATQYVSPLLLLLLLPIEAEEASRTLYFVFCSNSAVDSFEESDVSRSGGIKVGKIPK